jgi:hypothetical protein
MATVSLSTMNGTAPSKAFDADAFVEVILEWAFRAFC